MNNVKKGKFVTVEGQDGAGKTTNLEFVRQLLEASGVRVLATREPGGTRLGEELRKLILQGHDLNIDPVAELLLIFAARAQHLAETITPALNAGTWVLCDRFTDATYAYQSGARGLPEENVQVLEKLVQGPLQPDLTLLLDVDLDTGQSRCGQRNSAGQDRFEAQRDSFKQKVRQAYLGLAARHSDRIQVIDACTDLDSVQTQIRKVMGRFLENTD